MKATILYLSFGMLLMSVNVGLSQVPPTATEDQRALKISKISGVPPKEVLNALRLLTWCLDNPEGGMGLDFKGDPLNLSKTERDELFQYAISVIEYRHVAEASVSAPAAAQVTPSASVIESRIDGDFEGWEGETVFKLMNGQIWQQTDMRYRYGYKYSPKVLIYRSGAGWKMKVDGIADEIRVIQLR